MTRFVEAWRDNRPRLLNGYVEGVHEFAQFALEHRLALPRPTAVAVTASMLHPQQREFIQSVLGAPVYDCYRSAEVPWLAAECVFRSGLHVMADARRLEVIGPDGLSAPPGTEGDVVVSDLTNRVFPLLRYRIGDRSALLADACPCGRPLPLIQPISGRIADVLHGEDGRMVTGGFGSLFNDFPSAVRQFQLYQKRDRTVLLRCVPGPGYDRAAVETVAAGLRERLGASVTVRIELVEALAHAGGKVRLVTSELA
jgi:phenylacetate-CoA ligase